MLVILDFVILTLKAEGSSKVMYMKYNWMLWLRLSMTRSEPKHLALYGRRPITQKDFRWSTTGSPRDGIGCSFKLSNFF
ncbi:hypothetical protein B7991_02540 [Fibrobacter sp. UWB3]|nr:hypothetical protein B7991_02540 [Fibrobacter sp. UWB3]